MTNDERFEKWWASNDVECIPASAITQVEYEMFKDSARAAFNAALSDEDRETLLEICDEAMMAVTEEADNTYYRQARGNNALMRLERYAAVRRRLESLK